MVYTNIKRDKDMDLKILEFIHENIDGYALEGESFVLLIQDPKYFTG